jgi:hypothetical protein
MPLDQSPAITGAAVYSQRRPDCFDNAKGKRQTEALGASRDAAEREREDEAPVSALQGVHEHHERQGGDAEQGRHGLAEDEAERFLPVFLGLDG